MDPTKTNQQVIAEATEIIAKRYSVDPDAIIKKSRLQRLVDARKTTTYVLSKLLTMTTQELAEIHGYRSHSTAWRNIADVEKRIATDPEFAAWIKSTIVFLHEKYEVGRLHTPPTHH